MQGPYTFRFFHLSRVSRNRSLCKPEMYLQHLICFLCFSMLCLGDNVLLDENRLRAKLTDFGSAESRKVS